MEIDRLPDLKVEQAFELSDASAERSSSGCTIKLNKEPIIEYLNSNIVLMRWLISEGYGDERTIERRAQAMEAWLKNPELLVADEDAEYAEVIEINLDEKDYQSKIMIMGENSIQYINSIFGIDMSLTEGKSMFIALNKKPYGRIKLLLVNKNKCDCEHYEIYASKTEIN